MVDEPDSLRQGLGLLFRLRGVLDPTRAIPGLGASLSEAMTLQELHARGRASQWELGDFLGLEKSTVSRLVDALAAKGWVTKERDPANRRFAQVRLTEAGVRTAAEVAAVMRARHERILAALTPAEREAVAVGLTALVREMAAELDRVAGAATG
ncbi:MarR family winged helix-turn-helix transcriptional regulator [Couchioplanes azureus]|uniref:MarR family winged helix-turn-helix transcriptional regulator n=1 Tax=Couchioplanes caeruleus TaxID=56438 RepID=UPI0016706E9F|nr:MarR family transcriptional regulator [Couchioplanes caeruleus]GGQ48323.1 transcriptional regulator [Couchioplanes caeruleus subsp. azureus]